MSAIGGKADIARSDVTANEPNRTLRLSRESVTLAQHRQEILGPVPLVHLLVRTWDIGLSVFGCWGASGSLFGAHCSQAVVPGGPP
jgi:hypothetical protein